MPSGVCILSLSLSLSLTLSSSLERKPSPLVAAEWKREAPSYNTIIIIFNILVSTYTSTYICILYIGTERSIEQKIRVNQEHLGLTQYTEKQREDNNGLWIDRDAI